MVMVTMSAMVLMGMRITMYGRMKGNSKIQ